MEPPRLLSDFARPKGLLRADYEDFVVEEVPLYPFGGTGTHTFFLLEKRGLSTLQAVHDLARALGVQRREIGYAGLKDSRAVTRQWMSVEHVEPARLESVSIPRLRVLQVTRHTNKLRLGHLRGNRFVIRVREIDVNRAAEVRAAFEDLQRRGVPNYFGPQRFGMRGDGALIGAAIVRGDLHAALDRVLGCPEPNDDDRLREARALYVGGQFTRAARLWPGMFRDERRALQTLERTGGNVKRAFLSIDQGLRRFYVAAFQSELFNRVLSLRLNALGELWLGDMAYVHPFGAVFRVEDPAREQPRADALEVSPTGPLFGYRMSSPTGRAFEIEQAVLNESELALEELRRPHLRLKGARRQLRFPLLEARMELAADERGPYLEFGFQLPSGCYATAVLRELVDAPAVTARAVEGRDSEDEADDEN